MSFFIAAGRNYEKFHIKYSDPEQGPKNRVKLLVNKLKPGLAPLLCIKGNAVKKAFCEDNGSTGQLIEIYRCLKA